MSAPVKDEPAPVPPVVPATPLPAAAPEGVDQHFASLIHRGGFEAEQYRVLRHSLEQTRKADRLGVVAVTSPGIEDGKTTTAVNLAGALAQSGAARVLLADADLRRPSVAPRLSLIDGPGLVGAILDRHLTLKSVVRQLPGFNLSVLPAGQSSVMPYELLQSPRLGEVLEEARREYDHIIVDTPPFLVVPDSRLLEAWVDGFVVVVAANRTPRRLVEETLNVMDPGKILGLVFNRDHRPLSGYYRNYYNYYPSEPKRRGWRSWL
jgi:capsular exopolysaccharide synthesis family protein